MTELSLKARYGYEKLGLRNIDSCLIRRELAASVHKALARWESIFPHGKLLDIGCGAQPYRPWAEAAGLVYSGLDWGESIHEVPDRDVLLCDLTRPPWPVAANSADVLLCTEVLEHQPEPLLFLKECARLVRPGGELLLTAPLTWPEHEQPYDYFRYTRFGLSRLLEAAEFEAVELWPRGGWHLALAQLLGLWSYFGVPKPWNYATRIMVWPAMQLLAFVDHRTNPAKSRLPLTLGFSVIARRKPA